MSNYGVPTTGGGGGGGGGATIVSGQDTVTFSTNQTSTTLVVVDAGVSAASTIFASAATGARDGDELELSPLIISVSTVTPGVGYTLLITAPNGDADGDFTIHYQRVD